MPPPSFTNASGSRSSFLESFSATRPSNAKGGGLYGRGPAQSTTAAPVGILARRPLGGPRPVPEEDPQGHPEIERLSKLVVEVAAVRVRHRLRAVAGDGEGGRR